MFASEFLVVGYDSQVHEHILLTLELQSSNMLLFDIGSITKTFTTLLLADMVKEGIVNLNDRLKNTFLPM
jgi:CubicO group peptidase (beta-lactamase class C family)